MHSLPYSEKLEWIAAHAHTMRWCIDTERRLRTRARSQAAIATRLDALSTPTPTGPELHPLKDFYRLKDYKRPPIERLRQRLADAFDMNILAQRLIVRPNTERGIAVELRGASTLIEACHMAVASHFSPGGEAAPDCGRLFLAPDPGMRYCPPRAGSAVSALREPDKCQGVQDAQSLRELAVSGQIHTLGVA